MNNKLYIKFGNNLYEFVKFDGADAIVRANITFGLNDHREMSEVRLHNSVEWQWATQKEIEEYEMDKRNN